MLHVSLVGRSSMDGALISRIYRDVFIFSPASSGLVLDVEVEPPPERLLRQKLGSARGGGVENPGRMNGRIAKVLPSMLTLLSFGYGVIVHEERLE